jgi:hypothetical protein
MHRCGFSGDSSSSSSKTAGGAAKINTQLLDISVDKCGSHVLECLLAHITRVFDASANEADAEQVSIVASFVLRLATVLHGELQRVELDAYATHVLKTLIKVLAGKRLHFVR